MIVRLKLDVPASKERNLRRHLDGLKSRGRRQQLFKILSALSTEADELDIEVIEDDSSRMTRAKTKQTT